MSPMPADIFLLITLIGFGIQQFVQVIIDPFYTLAVAKLRAAKGNDGGENPPAALAGAGLHAVPGRISEVDSKKLVLGLATIAMAAAIVATGPDSLRLLDTFKVELEPGQRWLDDAITVLVISAGTEGANSILKLLQYAKMAVKERTPEASTTPQAPRRQP